MELEKSREFILPDGSLEIVKFKPVDFSPNTASFRDVVRKQLNLSGVMYDADAGKIYVADQMTDEMQGFSALHEHLCMHKKVAACVECELTVLKIQTPEQRVGYISLRAPLFEVLTELFPERTDIADARDSLRILKNPNQ
jgi:hypothetical protein